MPGTHTTLPDDLTCYQKFLLRTTLGRGSARIAVLLQRCSKAVSLGWRGRFQRADHWPPCSPLRWGADPTPRGPGPRLVEEAAGIGVFGELSRLGVPRQHMLKAEKTMVQHVYFCLNIKLARLVLVFHIFKYTKRVRNSLSFIQHPIKFELQWIYSQWKEHALHTCSSE